MSQEGKRVALPLRSVVSFATITAAGFVLGRVTGIVREMVVSAHFGLSGELDAYFLASLVPTMINNIVAGSAITAAVMPTFGRYIAAGQRKEFWRAASVITNVVLLICGALTLLGMLVAVPLISVLGADLAQSTRSLAAVLLVIMMPTLLLGAALNMLMAILNSLDRFVAPALIFLALNIGIIGTVILLSPYIGIYAVAWGFLIGVGLQVAIQIIEMRRERPEYSWRIDWHHPALREMTVAFIPITALSVVAQINLLVDRSMATSLPPGSISALYYADSILGSFYMVGISLGIAVFPSLSRLAAVNDVSATTRTIIASLRLLIFVLAPLTGLSIPFAAPIIGLILGRGKFDVAAVQMTSQAMSMYAIGLIAIAALYVLQRAFFAQSDSVTPFLVGLSTAAVHIGLNFILMRQFSHAGIALSTSFTAILAAVVLVVLLTRRLPGLDLKGLMGFTVQCAVMALVSTGLAGWAFRATRLGNETTLAWAVGVALAILGGLVYFGLAIIARVPESRMLLRTGMGLLRRGES